MVNICKKLYRTVQDITEVDGFCEIIQIKKNLEKQTLN